MESVQQSPRVLTSNKTIHQIGLLEYILSRFTIVACGGVYRQGIVTNFKYFMDAFAYEKIHASVLMYGCV